MLETITDNIDVWTSAQMKKSSVGRGTNSKQFSYGIKKLRELILELAVRGKLVPQDPNDEPASELLKKIQKEKEKLIEAGKFKKQKKVHAFNNSEELFALPTNWEWALIPQIVKAEKYAIKRGPFGSSIRKDYFVLAGYKVYEQQNAIYDDFRLGNYYIDENKFNELKAFEVKPGDLIISCSGTVGRVAVAPSWLEPGVINQALLKLSLNESVLTNAYFKILFPAFYMKTETLSNLQGTAQKNMVSVDTLKKEAFPLPPLAEQKRIVAKVDELMALCDRLEQEQENNLETHQALVTTLLNALTSSKNNQEFQETWQRIADCFDLLFTTEESIDQLKQTILQLAVMGKLVPQDPNDEPASELLKKIQKEKEKLVKEAKIKNQKPLPKIADDEKPFKLPDNWCWARLQTVSEYIQRGKSPTYADVGTVRVISQKCIQWEGFDISRAKFISDASLDAYQPERFLKNNDMLWNSTGTGTVGRVSVLKNIEEDSLVADSHVTVLRLMQIDSNFICLYISAPGIQSRIEPHHENSLVSGTTKQVELNTATVSALPVPLPPIAEQKRIVAKVEELMALCDGLKENLQQSETTKTHLADAIVEKAVSVEGV